MSATASRAQIIKHRLQRLECGDYPSGFGNTNDGDPVGILVG